MKFIENFRNEEKDWTNHLSKSKSIREKYPQRIPVIAGPSNPKELTLKNRKYLVPGDKTVGWFQNYIRTHFKTPLNESQSIFIFFGNEKFHTLAPMTALMSEIYVQHQDKTGYLFAIVCLESTFG